uniref:Adenylyl cyclase n=1 Tax=Neobodo designis TaxID=312471 RepID=A0A7S1PU12_NEODS
MWTMSPLARAAISTVFCTTVAVVTWFRGTGAVAFAVSTALSATVFLPLFNAFTEIMNREGFIEIRRAQALSRQLRAAATTRQAMLFGVVPPHVAGPLRRWLARGDTKTICFSESRTEVAVCVVVLRAIASAEDRGASEFVSAHAAVDALVAHCAHLQKVKAVGRRVVLAGPFDESRSFDTHDDHGPLTGGAAAVADAIHVIHALRGLGAIDSGCIAVGPVVGAVVGRDRLSYDVYGSAVADAIAGANSTLHDGHLRPCEVDEDAATTASTFPANGTVLATVAAVACLEGAAGVTSQLRGDRHTLYGTRTSLEPPDGVDPGDGIVGVDLSVRHKPAPRSMKARFGVSELMLQRPGHDAVAFREVLRQVAHE